MTFNTRCDGNYQHRFNDYTWQENIKLNTKGKGEDKKSTISVPMYWTIFSCSNWLKSAISWEGGKSTVRERNIKGKILRIK